MTSIRERMFRSFDRIYEHITVDLHGVQITRDESLGNSNEFIFYGDLQSAERSGYYPTSLSSIIDQLGVENVPNMVLFDSGSYWGVGGGNHWRVTKLLQDENEAKLRFTSIYGVIDFENVDEFTLPLDKVFFTGASIQEWTVDGNKSTLEDVSSIINVSGYPNKRIKCYDSAFYMSKMSTKRLQKISKSK